MIEAPTMPNAPAFIVFLKPSQMAARLSQMNCRSNAATTSTAQSNTSGRPRAAAQWFRCCLARADGLRRIRARIPQVDPRARSVVPERRVEAARNRPPQDPPEHVTRLHPADRRVDPALHGRLALADADPPGNVEE